MVSRETLLRHCSEEWSVVGGLSAPSKMPGWAYGLPARKTCPRGARLSQLDGTTCSVCYGGRGNYTFRPVREAQTRRFLATRGDGWTEAMSALLRFLSDRGEVWFRWHDTGDLYSDTYASKVAAVCKATPSLHHWIPTHEARGRLRPLWGLPNVTVRRSSDYNEQAPEAGYLLTSTVDWYGGAFNCPAPSQDNSCGSCRACWDAKVPNINYRKH